MRVLLGALPSERGPSRTRESGSKTRFSTELGALKAADTGVGGAVPLIPEGGPWGGEVLGPWLS